MTSRRLLIVLAASRAQQPKVVLLTFLDSKCTEAWPVIAALIAQTWRLLTKSEKAQVHAYAIRVNPLADTPVRVRRFLAVRRATAAPDWLVAPVSQMRPVWKAFGVFTRD